MGFFNTPEFHQIHNSFKSFHSCCGKLALVNTWGFIWLPVHTSDAIWDAQLAAAAVERCQLAPVLCRACTELAGIARVQRLLRLHRVSMFWMNPPQMSFVWMCPVTSGVPHILSGLESYKTSCLWRELSQSCCLPPTLCPNPVLGLGGHYASYSCSVLFSCLNYSRVILQKDKRIHFVFFWNSQWTVIKI